MRNNAIHARVTYITPEGEKVDDISPGMCTGVVSVWRIGWVSLYIYPPSTLTSSWVRFERDGSVVGIR